MKLRSLGLVILLCCGLCEMIPQSYGIRDHNNEAYSSHSIFFMGITIGSVVFLIALLSFMILTYRSRPMRPTSEDNVKTTKSNRPCDPLQLREAMPVMDSFTNITVGAGRIQHVLPSDSESDSRINLSAVGYLNPIYQAPRSPPESPSLRRRQQSNDEQINDSDTNSVEINTSCINPVLPKKEVGNSSATFAVDLLQRSFTSFQSTIANPFVNSLSRNEPQVCSLSPRRSQTPKQNKRKKTVSFKLERESYQSA